MKLHSKLIYVSVLAGAVTAQLKAGDGTDTLYARAIKLMSESPLIDTHVDLPQIIRGLRKY
jgi:membrane dipeptidase